MKRISEAEHTKFYIEIALAVVCLVLAFLFRENFAAAFVFSAAFIILMVRRIDWKRHRNLRRAVIACAILLGISFLIVESFVLSGFGTNDRAVSDVDYVVVLGSGLKGSKLSLTLKQRLDASLPYLNSHKRIPVIVSGGQGPGEDITEAEAMKRYLVSEGIEEGRIITEDQSTSTKENLTFSKSIIQERGVYNPAIIIVTSDFHMFRAKYIAQTLGFEAYGISGESVQYLKPINMIREYLAVIKALL